MWYFTVCWKEKKDETSGYYLTWIAAFGIQNDNNKLLNSIGVSTQLKQESICFNRDSWGPFGWPRSGADLIGMSMSIIRKPQFVSL